MFSFCLSISFVCLYIFSYTFFHFIDYTIDSVMVTHNGSSVPVIGSSTVYTITCTVTISCDGTCNENDTLTISWSLNGNNDVLASHTESNGSPFTVLDVGTFTSTLTTMGDISISHAGLYQCIANLTNAGTGGSDTTDFNVKRKYYQIY